MKKLMFATSLDYFIRRVEELLGDEYLIHTCGDEYDIMPEIEKFKPDILVISLMRFVEPRLQLARMISNLGTPIKLVALASFTDEYVLRILSNCGVSGIVQLPCKAEFLESHIRYASFLIDHPEEETWCVENEIDLLLMDLSFRRGPTRYQCVYEAIFNRYSNMDCSMKELYIDVAKQCGGNFQRVEKALRDAIADAYDSGDKRIWWEYFPVENKRDKPYPGNEDFITTIASCLHRRARYAKPFFRSKNRT